eukprot:7380239-Ditylum_brightwellii.AAC.1
MPRVGHLKLSRNIFGYLKEHPKRRYVINPTLLQLNLDYQKVDLKLDFGTQYSYFEEEPDARFPEPLLEELDLRIDSSDLDLKVAGSCPDINIWGRIHCLEESGRGGGHTLIPHEVNGDNSEETWVLFSMLQTPVVL